MQRRSYILLGLMFAVLLGVFVCLRMQERALIDFEQVEPIPGYKMEMREPPLRVAIISVLNHARTEGDQSRMVRSLGRLLGRPVLLLHRRSYAEINQLLAKGDADVAFLSSGAYMVYGKKEDVRLLAMPERNGASSYFSYVIVPRAGKAESLEELRVDTSLGQIQDIWTRYDDRTAGGGHGAACCNRRRDRAHGPHGLHHRLRIRGCLHGLCRRPLRLDGRLHQPHRLLRPRDFLPLHDHGREESSLNIIDTAAPVPLRGRRFLPCLLIRGIGAENLRDLSFVTVRSLRGR